MEGALEQVGLASKYQTELANYVSDLRNEAADIKTARKIVGGTALVASGVLFITPVAIASIGPTWFTALPVYLGASLIIGMFAAGVLLITAMARAVFRSAHERQADEFIPPQIKQIHELSKVASGDP